MARTVGAIEVTVYGDTSRLKAQLVKDAKVSGKQMQKAINDELDGLKAQIDKTKTLNEARLLAKQIEAQLRGLEATVEINFPIEEQTAKYKQWKEAREADELLVRIGLNETSVREAAARLRTMTAEQRQVVIDSDLDTAEVEAELARLDARDLTVDFLVQLDKQLAEEGLDDLERGRRVAEIIATLDTTQATIAAELYREAQRRRKIEFEATANFDALSASINQIMDDPDFGVLAFRATIDRKAEAALFAEVERITEEAGIGHPVHVPVEAEMAKFRAELALDLKQIEATVDEVRVPVEPDVDQFEFALARLRTRMGEIGEVGGDAYGSGFGRGMSTRMKLIIGGVLALAEPVGVLLKGGLASATSILSSAFAGLAGGAGAALPLMVSLGATAGTVAVGFAGVGDALSAVSEEFATAAAEGRAFNIEAEGIQKAMGGLAPAAQDFVAAFSEVRDELAVIQSTVQERLFAGLGDQMRELSATVLPDVSAAMSTLADSANRFFVQLGDLAAATDFSRIFDTLQPASEAMGDALIEVLGTLEPFLLAAAPAAENLATSLQHGAESLRRLVESGAESGALGLFLDQGVESLKDWARLLGSVSSALFTVFEAGRESGDRFVTELRDIVDDWNDWMKSVEGQQALANFFADGERILRSLGPLVEGVAGFFENLVTDEAIDRTAALADSLGRILPALGSLLDLLGRSQIVNVLAEALALVADALERAMPQLQAFADAIGERLLAALEFVGPLIESLVGFIGNLAGAFAELDGPMQTVLIALGGFALLHGKIATFATNFGNSMHNIRTAMSLTGTAIGVGALSVREALAGMFTLNAEKFRQGISGLNATIVPALKGVGAAAGVVLGGALAVAFGAQMLAEADNMGQQMIGALSIATAAAGSFFAAGGGPQGAALAGITLAVGAVTALFAASANAAKKAKAEVDEYVEALEGIGPAADQAATVAEVMNNLRDEQERTRDQFLDMKFLVEDWAAGLVDGSTTAQSGMADLAEKAGAVGKEIAAGLRDGTISFEDMERQIDDAGGMWQALADGPARDLLKAFDEMGIEGEVVREMFDFLTDEAREHGVAEEENARRTREAAGAFEEKAAEVDIAGSVLEDYQVLLDQLTGDIPLVTDAVDDSTVAFEDNAEAIEKVVDALKATGELRKLDSMFARIGRRGEALQRVFDIGNVPEEVAGEIRDIEIAIDDLSDAAEDVKISDVIAGNIEADDVLDALDDLRPEMQKQIIDTFSVGGEDAAIALAEDYITKVQEELGGSDVISREEVARMLGLDNILVMIEAAVSQASIDEAREKLEVLSKLADDTPFTVQLGLDLESGLISPDAMQAIVDAMLREHGIKVPVDPEISPEEYEEARQYLIDNKLIAPLGLIPEIDPTAPPVFAEGMPMPVSPVPGLDFDVATASLFAAGAEVPVTPALDPTFDLATASLFGLGATIAVTPVAAPDFNAVTDTLFGDGIKVPVTPELPANFDWATASSFAPAGAAAGTAAIKVPIDADKSLFDTAFEEIEEKLLGLDEKSVTPSVTLSGYTLTNTRLDTLDEKLTDLDAMTASVTITLPGITARISEVDRLDAEIDGLRNRSITITTNLVTTGDGGMTGRMITHPQTMNVGERGYAEALVPLQLPLNRIDPSVRHLAELIRGGGKTAQPSGGIGRQVNNYMTITPRSADPAAVATQLINRAASMAAR